MMCWIVPKRQLSVLTMAASMPDGFDSWLSVKLKALNTDENVFGFYIKGILEGEETQDEKIEALEGILGEISPVIRTTLVLIPYVLNRFLHFLIEFDVSCHV